jgi:hypothetical protein
LQHAIATLTTSPVAERDGTYYNREEFRAYCDGWYRALAHAIAVTNLALERRRLRLGAKREEPTWGTPHDPQTRARCTPIASARSTRRASASVAPAPASRATRKRSESAIASSTR